MEVANNVMSATIEAVITRADGTVERLGVIDEFNRDGDLVACAICEARMHRYELQEHEAHCVVLGLAQEVDKMISGQRKDATDGDSSY
jgi:hypothetical protein